MDALTHLFLPITVAYVLRPDLFESPLAFPLAGFALLPDVDKLFGLQGVLHSPLTLAPIAALLLLAESLSHERIEYSALAAVLLYSHLLLDFVDGGPVLVLYPLFDVGIGLRYPAQLVIGSATTVAVTNPLPQLTANAATRGPATYPLVDGYGVLSFLTFLVIYVGREANRWRGR